MYHSSQDEENSKLEPGTDNKKEKERESNYLLEKRPSQPNTMPNVLLKTQTK